MITEWTTTKEDNELIIKIGDRVSEQFPNYPDCQGIFMMDLEAVHMKMPLDLERLLNSPRTDFAHDISGIRNHIDRETGELKDCFLPRCGTKKE